MWKPPASRLQLYLSHTKAHKTISMKEVTTMKTMNKTISFFAIATFLAIVLAGCKGEKITPCGCEDVVYWAPDTCSFSWSEYNSTVQVKNYFCHHDSTLATHNGDTLRLCGWVYFPCHDEPVLTPNRFSPLGYLEHDYGPDVPIIHLVTHKDYPGYSRQSEILDVQWGSPFLNENPWFRQDFDSLLYRKWYVTATVYAGHLYFPNYTCDKYTPTFTMIALDTIPDNN